MIVRKVRASETQKQLRELFCKKMFLKIWENSQKDTCVEVSFFNKIAGLRPSTLLKKETPTQVFFCEFCQIFKNNFFYRTLTVAASGNS